MTNETSEVWITDEYTNVYGDLVLPGEVTDDTLEIYVIFERFEFLRTDDPPDKDEPWEYPTMPDAILAWTTGEHGQEFRLDIPVTAPAAKKLLQAGLVPDVPDYIKRWLQGEEANDAV